MNATSNSSSYIRMAAINVELSAKFDEAKARLVGLAGHAREQGGGVSVTRLWKRGSVEYKRVPELVDVDLEPYRSSSREEVRVTIV
jgi:hypothetical protein